MDIERNYLRRSYRVRIPAKVYIEKKEYPVKDWSFLGFRIGNADERIEPNKEYYIEFELPFVNFLMRFKAKAICRWKKDNDAGFEFEELPDDTKLLMKEYVEAYIEGRLTEENGLLKLAQGLEIPISTDVTITPEEEKELNKKLIKNTFIVIGIFIIALIIGFLIYINRKSVYSAQAFVSGKTFYIKSPVSGIIQNIYITPLSKVKKGQTIAFINNSEIQTQIKEIKTNIENIKSEISKLNKTLEKEKKAIDIKYETKLKEKRLKLQSLKNELNTKLSLLTKYLKEYKLGIIHFSQIENLKSEIKDIKTQIEILKNSKITKNYSSLIPIKNLILSQQNNLMKLKDLLNLLYIKQQNFVIKSPVNGKVLSIYTKPKSFITKNSLISTIEINAKGYVIARFKFKDATQISIGDKAEIYVPANDEIYEGVVTAIGKNAIKANSIFSESNTYAQKDVPVKINFLYNNNLEDGIFAEVKIFIK